jgi:uncharacterized membrane protein
MVRHDNDRMDAPVQERPLPPGSWLRGESPEFDRLAFFTDAVYAIAMTLLVLEVKITPMLRNADDPSMLWSRLGDLVPQLVAFGVAFILLGRYWMAHHAFFASLRAFDRRLMGLNLVYLAFVAVLPFPSALVGEYEQNPLSVIIFAVTLSSISGMETVLFAHAHHTGLLRSTLDRAAFRWEAVASLQPVAVFLVTIPLAFVSTTLTLLSWAAVAPLLGALLNRFKPASLAANDLPLVIDQGRWSHRRSASGVPPGDTPPADGTALDDG